MNLPIPVVNTASTSNPELIAPDANTAHAACKPSHKPKSQSALRLVKTKDLSRDEWLQARRSGLGSSDAATALGLNPYQSRLALWIEKTRPEQSLNQIDPSDDSHPTYWGTVLEPIVATHYSKRTGNKIRRVNAILQHPEHPFMLANLDREVVGQSEVQILECKTAGAYGAKAWKDGVPEYVLVQVMHQLAVTGKQAADVAVLIAGQDLQIHRVHRDEELIAKLIELEAQFWWHVENNIPPPADGSDSAAQALHTLFRQDNGHILDLTFDADMNAVFDELVKVRANLDEYKAKESLLKQRIQQTMAEHSHVQFRNGSVSWKKTADAKVLDSKRLSQEHPDLVAQYFTTRAGSRRFTVLA